MTNEIDEILGDDKDKDVTPPVFRLTDEQSSAITRILEWFSDPYSLNSFKLGGYAGTGKTTVIKELISHILAMKKRVRVSAFTGKACSVLIRKGVQAQTLHSLIYDCEFDPVTKQLMFYKRYAMDGIPDLVIVDESSMINREIMNDLLSYNKKYLFVGDPGQLEPIGDNPNLMAQPDIILSKIHRQAELSPIITFANNVRMGEKPSIRELAGLIVRGQACGMNSQEFLSMGQVICARNHTRRKFNRSIRQFQGKPEKQVVPGDKLIVLKNNRRLGVFNGLIFFADEIEDGVIHGHDETDKEVHIPVWGKPFHEPEKEFEMGQAPNDQAWCDYAYAITCHKSQGSEWDRVLVWREYMPPKMWDMKRWDYTAITRAAKELVYCI